MIIDSHLHVYADDESLFPYVAGGKPARPASVEYLLPLMDEAGVDKAVIVQPRVYSWDNRYLAHCIERFPDRFTALGLVDPTSPNGPDRLEALVREQRFSGLRLELGWEDDLDDFHGKDRWPLWERAQELGAAFGILGSAKDHSCVEPMAAMFPGVNILLDHLGGLPLDPEAAGVPDQSDVAPWEIPERLREAIQLAGQVERAVSLPRHSRSRAAHLRRLRPRTAHVGNRLPRRDD